MNHLLIEESREFAKKNVDPMYGYEPLCPKDEQIRHALLHTVKAAGKLAIGNKDQIIDEVIGATAFYRTKLITNLNLPQNIYPLRLVGGEKPEMSAIKDMIAEANMELASFIEPQEHGGPRQPGKLSTTAFKLHAVSLGLGEIYDVDPIVKHLEWMQRLAGGHATKPLIQTPATTGTEA